jgi:hypothetical protein
MKEWTAARDHVNDVRKTDPKTAEKLSKEITDVRILYAHCGPAVTSHGVLD